MAQDNSSASGWFGIVGGIAIILAGVFYVSTDLKPDNPFYGEAAKTYRDYGVAFWFFLSGATAAIWGLQKVKRVPDSKMVGQATINFILAIAGVGIALIALNEAADAPTLKKKDIVDALREVRDEEPRPLTRADLEWAIDLSKSDRSTDLTDEQVLRALKALLRDAANDEAQ